jgi:hypothetical protein
VVGPITNTANGAASAPAELLNGAPYTAGTATTDFPLFFAQPSGATASTTWATGGTFLGVNAATGFAGNLADLQVAGASQFSVSSAGVVNAAGSITGSAIVASSGGVTVPASQCFTVSTKTKMCTGVAGQMVIEGTSGANTVTFDSFGHQLSGNSVSGAAPTCSTGCASIVGTDARLTATTNSAVTSEIITFGHTWTTAPICVANEAATSPVAIGVVATATTVTLNFTSLTSQPINVSCAQ